MMIILSKDFHARLPRLDDVLKRALDDALVEVAMNVNVGEVFKFFPFPRNEIYSPLPKSPEPVEMVTVDLRRGGTVKGSPKTFFQAARDDKIRNTLEKVVKERWLSKLMDVLLSGDGS